MKTNASSATLLKMQLQYMGRIARNNEHPGRELIFKKGEMQCVEMQGQRRRGRPRLNWGRELMNHINIFSANVSDDISDPTRWNSLCNKYCSK